MTGFEQWTSGIGSEALPTEQHNHCPRALLLKRRREITLDIKRVREIINFC